MVLTFASDFEWRFLPVVGRGNRCWFIIHGGDERKYCGESERISLIEDDGIPQTVFLTKDKNRQSLKEHFNAINAYQFLHSALPDHAIRRYFPQVIPAMEARLSDKYEKEKGNRMKNRFRTNRH